MAYRVYGLGLCALLEGLGLRVFRVYRGLGFMFVGFIRIWVIGCARFAGLS